MIGKRVWLSALVGCLLPSCPVGTVLADTFEWTDPNSGDFDVAANWAPGGGPPNTGDTALFNEAGTYTVTFNEDEISDALDLNAGDVTFRSGGIDRTFGMNSSAQLSGGTLTLGVPADPLHLTLGSDLSIHGDATLSIQHGSDVTVSNLLTLGASGSGTGGGMITVSGGGAKLDALNAVNLGANGTAGILNVQSGASAQLATSSGTLRVGNSVFAGTVGTLSVESSSFVFTGNIDVATGDSLATGTVTVTGPGSSLIQTLDGASLSVGNASTGTGTVNIQSGGTFTTANLGTATIGATGAINLQGGTLHARAGLDNSAGGTLNFANGTLNVTGGAFAPNAGGPSDDFLIDGTTVLSLPRLVIGAGASGNIGNDLFVGKANRGELTIIDGGAVSNNFGTIGDLNNSTGTVTVTGVGSTWTNSASLRVGMSGSGTLSITNGGAVSNTAGTIASEFGSNGTATVTGVGSTWTNSGVMQVGVFGSGTLNITDGGVVSNTSGTLAFSDFSSNGTATVAGAGSTWTNSGNLVVGSVGDAALNIQNGGAVSNTDGTIASDLLSASTATVTGVGSTWTNSGVLRVGNAGSGTLNITSGGAVSNTDGFIGRFQGAAGFPVPISTATVAGPGSTWTNSGSLYVGGRTTSAGGTGTLNVQTGGLVVVDGVLKIWAPGAVNLSGGTVDATTITHTSGGTFLFTAGTLLVETFHGHLDNQGGILAPGASAGTTTITGNYEQKTGAVLDIEIGGTLSGTQYDVININGNAVLGGDLQLTLINDFVPNDPNGAFSVLDAASLTGVFDNVNAGLRLFTSDGLGSFAVNYGASSSFDPTQVVLTDFLFAADFDGDGDVDNADLAQWEGDYGLNGDSDADSDGDSDGFDFLIWQQQFTGSLPLSGIVAVPEPAAIGLSLLGWVGIMMSRQRRIQWARY